MNVAPATEQVNVRTITTTHFVLHCSMVWRRQLLGKWMSVPRAESIRNAGSVRFAVVLGYRTISSQSQRIRKCPRLRKTATGAFLYTGGHEQVAGRTKNKELD